MNSVWQRFTLSYVPFREWQRASYLHPMLVGPLRSWRQSSWLMQWADLIALFLVSLVFGLAPFVSNELVGWLLTACMAFWVLLTLSDDPQQSQASLSPTLTPIHLLVLLYWGIATAATALSPVKSAALQGLGKLTLYLLLFVLCARVLRSPRLRSWLITFYLHIALLVSIYGLRQWFFGAAALATWSDPDSPFAKTTRVYSYLGNPNLLAGYLLPAVILSLAALLAWRSWTAKALAATMFIVNTSCLVCTFSRGGWLGLIVAIFVFLGLLMYWWHSYIPPFWRIWSIPILLGSISLLLLSAMLISEPLRERFLSIFAGRGDSSNNFRINVVTGVLELIRGRYPENRPLPNFIFGIGPGNTAFNKIYPIYQINPRYTALSAYSILLEVTVETGIIGLASFLWLLFVTFHQGWQQLQRLRQIDNQEAFWLIGAIASLLGMLTHGMVDTVLYRPAVNTLWWLMIAIIASYYSRKREEGIDEGMTIPG